MRVHEPTPRRPAATLHWGSWTYLTAPPQLHHVAGRYYVDLERLTSGARALDWIAQIAGKAWCSDEDLGHFVRALDDLLGLQAHFCSFGEDRQLPAVQVRALAERGARETRAYRRWKAELKAKGVVAYSTSEWARLEELEREEGL
jgi:hypothetical protein